MYKRSRGESLALYRLRAVRHEVSRHDVQCCVEWSESDRETIIVTRYQGLTPIATFTLKSKNKAKLGEALEQLYQWLHLRITNNYTY